MAYSMLVLQKKAAIFGLPWKKFCPIEQHSGCGSVLGAADENEIRNVACLIGLFLDMNTAFLN